MSAPKINARIDEDSPVKVRSKVTKKKRFVESDDEDTGSVPGSRIKKELDHEKVSVNGDDRHQGACLVDVLNV